jgi:type II secretory pathway pseudopilin PulG
MGGFTLVEVLLYVSISGALLVAVSILFALMLQARVDHEAVAEVEGQGNATMQIMLQTIRNARAVNSPSTSTPSYTLSLTVVTSTYNPTIFTLATGTIRMFEGSVASTSITTNRILISTTSFQNLSRSNTSGTIRIQFTAVYKSSSTVGRTTYQKTFTGSASLR